MQDNIFEWLKIVMIFGVGSKRIWEMSANYDGISEFLQAVENHGISELTEEEYNKADSISDDNVSEILKLCSERGIKYYSYESEGYPAQLRRIANPPAVLFFKGNLDFLNDKCLLEFVGTRRPSVYSLDITDKLCAELMKRGFVLSSGFAEGIDQRVNEACILQNSFPVAVCATEIDADYPKGSRELKEKIAEKGVVISEYYPTCKTVSGSFANRNRISVGLSSGVIFIEARKDSRGLDNYDHAIYQGKPVFVVPPADIFDKRYFGQSDLIRNGCTVLCSPDDIVYELAGGKFLNKGIMKSLDELAVPPGDSVFFNHGGEARKNTAVKKTVSKGKTEHKKEIAADLSQLDDTQKSVCEMLMKKDMLADEIAGGLSMDIGEVLSVLTELEMLGIIKSLPGKMFGIFR